MRSTLLLLTMICLAACGTPSTRSDEALLSQDDWRQRQVVLDTEAILQGMAQARQRAEQMARTGR